jgi:tetratricopeptide (TPR) repeat protein
MKVGKLNAALDDFTLADKLQPTGQTQAGLGYCYSALGHDRWAVGYYSFAIQRDFKTAVVFNNLGYSLMCAKDGADEEAAECFRKAIKANPRLQIAYYNQATLALKKAWRDRSRVSSQTLREGLEAITRAIELGPESGQIHLAAAHLWVLAAKIEPGWKELAFEQLGAAIDRGLPPANDVKIDQILRPLHGDRFNHLIERPAVKSAQTPLLRVLDPLQGN